MATESPEFSLKEREVAEITAFCEIAKLNKSLLSLGELVQLTSVDATEEDFELAWNGNKYLSSRFRLESGYIIGDHPRWSSGRAKTEDDSRRRARVNLRLASEFGELCKGANVRMVAVAGGNSYRRAKRGDDIDLFCVTSRDSLWLFMLKALLLARAYSLVRKTPPFCLSYVMEEQKAASEFREPKDGLFARDALSAQVLSGEGFYQGLLTSAAWIRRYFPRMYARRLSTRVTEKDEGHSKGYAPLNRFLYLTVGTYVRMKAALLNRRYKQKGYSSALFVPSVGIDHCVYESVRYKTLRRIYAAVDEVPKK